MMLSALVLFKSAASQSCGAVYAAGVPFAPLDACFASVSDAATVTYQYSCSGGSAVTQSFTNGDCSGSPAAEAELTGYDDVDCDADPCSFAEVRVESGTADDCDSSSYSTYGYVVDECYESARDFPTAWPRAVTPMALCSTATPATIRTARAASPRRRPFSPRTRRAPPLAAAE